MSISAEFERAKDILPYGAADIIGGQLQAVAAKDSSTLGITFGVSLLLSLWSANSGTKALLDALNVAYGEEEKRSFIKLNTVSLAMTLGGLVFVVVALGAFVALPVILNDAPAGPPCGVGDQYRALDPHDWRSSRWRSRALPFRARAGRSRSGAGSRWAA